MLEKKNTEKYEWKKNKTKPDIVHKRVTVLAVYGPIDDSSATEKDNFINKLRSEITKLNKNLK